MLTTRERKMAILLARLDDVYWFSIPEFETFIRQTIGEDKEFADEIKKHLMFNQSLKRWDEIKKSSNKEA